MARCKQEWLLPSLCKEESGSGAAGGRNVQLGGKLLISKQTERERGVPQHVSTPVVVGEGRRAPFVAPAGLRSGWALCRSHPGI